MRSARRFLTSVVTSAGVSALPSLLVDDAELLRLAWCGVLALPVGVACGAHSRSLREGAWTAAGAWCGAGLVLAWGGLPSGAAGGLPLGAALASALTALGALGLLGLGCGRFVSNSTAWTAAAFVGALVATGLSTGFALLARPPGALSPRLGALLVDLSPAALVVETAGGDWMRAPGIYDPAGTEWFSDQRAPYPVPWGSGGPRAAFERAGAKSLATPLLGVVGCALVLRSRRRGRPTPR